MKKLHFLAGLFGIILICGFTFTACDMAGSTPEIVDAMEPVLTGEESLPYQKVLLSTGWADLYIEAASPDGGALSFQWYYLPETYDSPNGTPISDAVSDTIEIELTEAGIGHYYVEITNTNNRINGKKTAAIRSGIKTIFAYAAGTSVFPPVIREQPSDQTAMTGEITLSVSAERDDADAEGSVLSYQWYSSNTNGNKNGTTVTAVGADTNELKIDLTPGTYYFYVVITSALDDETISITSRPATVEIVGHMEANATIVLNANRKYQYVRGFGGMDIPWNNFFNITMDEYEKLYNPDTGLGFNIMRIMIMPENPEDNTDPEKTIDYYLGEGGRPNYIEGVKLVNRYNGYVLASPWSPPPEWKSNGTKDGGGHLISTYYVPYANYLKTFCQVMLERGAPIYAVSIQNEPNFTASYDGCEWTPQEMRDFFKTAGVGSFTDGVTGWGSGVEIPRVLIMNGESANHPNINDAALDDPVSRNVIDVIGRHTYGDVLNRYAKAIDLGKEVWMTEHNINSGNAVSYPNDSTWNYIWMFMNDVDVSIRLNDESAFIWWALKRFYSFIGDGAYGTVEGTILPRGYAMSHYAKYAKETWRIGLAAQTGSTTADGTALTASNFNNTAFDRNSTAAKATAFISEDGNTISVILWTPTNTSGGRGVDMGTIKIQLPSGFIASSATAMRSTAAVKTKMEDVLMAADRNSAIVMLPPGNIVSMRFTK